MFQLVKRHPRWLASTAIIAAVAGAFLAWGPVGLGNGPLWMPAVSGGVYSWTAPRTEPVGYVLPIGNDGSGTAVIDSVGVTASSKFAPPVLRRALIGHMDHYGCIALGPFGGHEPVLAGCVQPLRTGAAGAVIPAGTAPSVRKHQPALVLKLSGPRPRQCWDITSVVVRYHIGIRHYVATFPQGDVIACGVGGKAPGRQPQLSECRPGFAAWPGYRSPRPATGH